MAKVNFTVARIAAFRCPQDKHQAFLWDLAAPGLGLRVTPRGHPTFVFQGTFRSQSVRLSIGSPDAWTIPQAQKKAREFQRSIDEGRDPRELKAASIAAASQAVEKTRREAATMIEAWHAYLEDRRCAWGERHFEDHLKLVKCGGQPSVRGTRGRGSTIDGPLHQLSLMRLRDLTEQVLDSWSAEQAETRPTYGRLAWRCLKAFLRWCETHETFKGLLPSADPASTRRSRQAFGKQSAKTDVLLKEQLSAWFSSVRELRNPVVAAYLQAVLLTGARPGEMLSLRWDDIDWTWNSLSIRDKANGRRAVPLTQHMRLIIDGLPRSNQWVFSSSASLDGKLTNPRYQHQQACSESAIVGLSLHGLRRSFGSLAEWCDLPAGVIAQIMGHKPSAIAEKHYRVRPLDLLRKHHQRMEDWMLEQAGVANTNADPNHEP